MWVKGQYSVVTELQIATWGEGIYFLITVQRTVTLEHQIQFRSHSVFTHFKGFYFTHLLGFNVLNLQTNTNV